MLFKLPGLWDKFDVDFILGKRDYLNILVNLDIFGKKTYDKSSWLKIPL